MFEIQDIQELFYLIEETEKTLVVQYFADWCIPCKGQSVVLNRVQKEINNENITFAKFNVDNADVQGIEAIPTIIFYKNGIEKYKIVGLTDFKRINIILNLLLVK